MYYGQIKKREANLKSCTIHTRLFFYVRHALNSRSELLQSKFKTMLSTLFLRTLQPHVQHVYPTPLHLSPLVLLSIVFKVGWLKPRWIPSGNHWYTVLSAVTNTDRWELSIVKEKWGVGKVCIARGMVLGYLNCVHQVFGISLHSSAIVLSYSNNLGRQDTDLRSSSMHELVVL